MFELVQAATGMDDFPLKPGLCLYGFMCGYFGCSNYSTKIISSVELKEGVYSIGTYSLDEHEAALILNPHLQLNKECVPLLILSSNEYLNEHDDDLIKDTDKLKHLFSLVNGN